MSQATPATSDSHSWVDYGSCRPGHDLLKPYISAFTYSIGCLHEQHAKYITRAYPTVMTQLYFEFSGGLSEVRDRDGAFAFSSGRSGNGTVIEKRTYIKQGLGGWFDIFQLPGKQASRPIRNLKIDLYPNTLYRLFNLSPSELRGEDLQLADLVGTATGSLMLEEMEAAPTGRTMAAVAERYLLEYALRRHGGAAHKESNPGIPGPGDSLSQLARDFEKSERWLQKQYAGIYGMSFKQMQGNLRFYRAHQLLTKALQANTPTNLTELAYQLNYFDQAHFIREFRRYAGMTPGQYVRANVRPENQSLFYW